VYDISLLSLLEQVYGLIFLFKHTPSTTSTTLPKQQQQQEQVYFCKQVINNACATLGKTTLLNFFNPFVTEKAILGVLLNNSQIQLGDTLEQFKQFTKDFTPEMKGIAITNSEDLRSVHNSFAR
jgi:ubiquitin carboxyl-terminal hydrolase L5